MFKKLLSITVCLAMCMALLPVSVQATDADEAAAPEIPTEGDVWDGSTTQPTKLVQKDGVYYYEITKCSELAYVAQTGGEWLSYNYILGNNLILNDVELTWNDGICVNSEELLTWKPIGTSDVDYSGCFDGSGFTISGLYVPVGLYDGGLFGRCEYAELKNITIKNSYVYGTNAGGLTAFIDYSTIKNCSFSGCVSGRNFAGGLVGHSAVSSYLNCSTTGYVKAKPAAGGFLAECNGDTIVSCISYATVSGDTSIGGFVGEGWNLNALIEKCAAFGNVTGQDAVGGFIGFAYNTDIKKCCSFGSAVATNGIAGGFAGKTQNKHYDACSIENCFSVGNVSATTNAAGFAGSCATTIKDCYTLGLVDCINGNGGFIGDDHRIWGETFLISNCYFLKDLSINEFLWGTSTATSDKLGEIEGKTSNLLMSRSTYSGWNFEDVWSISAEKNGGYPYLQWQESILSDIPVNSVQISKTALSLSEGDYAYLTATVSPVNASNQSITWSSSDSDIAPVSAAGKVTAISAGTTTITATTEDGGYTTTCTVTVTERLADEYQINSITVRDSDGKKLSAIPNEEFLATMSITNIASEGNTLVLLASYSAKGQYQGMMWVSVEDLPVGATCKVTLPVDNSDGKIENLKAFTVASFSNLTPLGDVVSFLTE